METERITLSQRERDRLKVLHEVQQKHLSQVAAADRLKVTDRQVRRMLLWEWRRGWDSNPRYGSPYARFRGEYFQPLSHLSAVVGVISLAEARFPRLRRARKGIQRREAKKDCSREADSSARILGVTST